MTRTPAWTAGGPGIDLAAPEFYTTERHFEVWREARAKHPVAWASSEAGDFWSITAYEPGMQVLKQPKVFISEQGMRLGGNAVAVRRAAGKMLVVADGSKHRRLRGIQASWFTTQAVANMRPELESKLRAHLDRLIARGTPFDAVQELAAKIPSWILCQLMGVPKSDWNRLSRLTDAAFNDSDDTRDGMVARVEAHSEIFSYFGELLEHRRTNPGNDIVSTLAHAEVGGEKLTEEEILFNCDGLMNGGLETTPHAIAGAILAFTRFPETWQQLRKDSELIDAAIDEILRWTSPPMHVMRTATEDVTIGEAEVKAGDKVVVWLPSCDRDETIYPDPDRFVIERWPNPNAHVGFGGGPHYCVGAKLARMEIQVVLELMLPLVQEFELAGEIRRKRSNFLHGFDRLDVTITPARN
ncbi:cytochrome P450 [Lentzea sp. NBRC 105346]|uniref:cytochrome P450 n=1 Tax=Lentzea sp. NBRC 105346 TaxID=3032205 RepID=UPI002555CBCE|nr:cytochrome P450 [Lentzea sp. NBRC 105346]